VRIKVTSRLKEMTGKDQPRLRRSLNPEPLMRRPALGLIGYLAGWEKDQSRESKLYPTKRNNAGTQLLQEAHSGRGQSENRGGEEATKGRTKMEVNQDYRMKEGNSAKGSKKEIVLGRGNKRKIGKED